MTTIQIRQRVDHIESQLRRIAQPADAFDQTGHIAAELLALLPRDARYAHLIRRAERLAADLVARAQMTATERRSSSSAFLRARLLALEVDLARVWEAAQEEAEAAKENAS